MELKLKENAVYVRLNRIRSSLKEYMKKGRRVFGMVVAAALVIVIGVNVLSAPMRISANEVAKAFDPRMLERPALDKYKERDKWKE